MITDRAQIRKYFKKFPVYAVLILIFLAFPSLLIGVSTSSAFGTVSLFWAAVWSALGIWRLISYYQKPTDAEMDALIAQDMQGLRARALAKTGLDPSELISESVMVYGPRFWDVGGAELGIKRGNDGIVRFMPIGITIINFTPHQLSAYQCALDLMTGNPLSESTDEYFYKDVVSVSTQSKSKTYHVASKISGLLAPDGVLQLNSAETFVLTTSGGTSIEVVISAPKLIEGVGGGSMPTDVAEKAVQTVRKMLREKKIATATA